MHAGNHPSYLLMPLREREYAELYISSLQQEIKIIKNKFESISKINPVSRFIPALHIKKVDRPAELTTMNITKL